MLGFGEVGERWGVLGASYFPWGEADPAHVWDQVNVSPSRGDLQFS